MYQRDQQFCNVVNHVTPKTTTIDTKGGLEMKTFISSRCADYKSVLADLLAFMEVKVLSGEISAAFQMWKKRIAPNLKSSAGGKLIIAMMPPFRFETR